MARPNLHIMAWRNLWRNRRRTGLTLASFAFGVLLAVLFTGVGDSSYGKMIDLAARTGAGHVTYQHLEYRDAPSQKKTITGVSELRSFARSHPRVTHAVPRVAGAAMLAAATKSYGTYFVAVDPAVETPATLSVVSSFSEGAMFPASDSKGIVLGATLASNLRVGIGRKVVYTVTDRHGEIVSSLARVSGIIRTGSPSVDRGLCLLPLARMRTVMGYDPDEATLLAVFIDDQRTSTSVAEDLAALSTGTTTALPWNQTNPDLAGFIGMDRAGTVVFEAIILLLVAAGIFNSLFVSVMERRREFGIMLAVGFSPFQLFALVMWESLWISLVGLLTSAAVTAAPYWYLNSRGLDYSSALGTDLEISGVTLDPILYSEIYPDHLAYVIVAVVVTTLAAGLYPAWRAGRVVPVEAIKLV